MKTFIFKKTNILIFVFVLIIIATLAGCALFNDSMNTIKGQLVGNSYTIYQFDNYGDRSGIPMSGERVAINPFEPTYDAEGKKELTSVLDITIDGNQILSVGNTLIFEQKGINSMASFEEIMEFAEVNSSSKGLRFIPWDRFINSLRNNMGTAKMIIVYSQLGTPIGIYQGDSVFVTVPDDLPKMTRLSIDGYSLYLHRVNYTIIDKDLLN